MPAIFSFEIESCTFCFYAFSIVCFEFISRLCENSDITNSIWAASFSLFAESFSSYQFRFVAVWIWMHVANNRRIEWNQVMGFYLTGFAASVLINSTPHCVTFSVWLVHSIIYNLRDFSAITLRACCDVNISTCSFALTNVELKLPIDSHIKESHCSSYLYHGKCMSFDSNVLVKFHSMKLRMFISSFETTFTSSGWVCVGSWNDRKKRCNFKIHFKLISVRFPFLKSIIFFATKMCQCYVINIDLWIWYETIAHECYPLDPIVCLNTYRRNHATVWMEAKANAKRFESVHVYLISDTQCQIAVNSRANWVERKE